MLAFPPVRVSKPGLTIGWRSHSKISGLLGEGQARHTEAEKAPPEHTASSGPRGARGKAFWAERPVVVLGKFQGKGSPPPRQPPQRQAKAGGRKSHS